MKIWQIALIAVAVIAVGVGAFFGGKATGGGTPSPEEAMAVLRNLTPEQSQQAFQGDNGPGGAGFANGGGFPGPGGNRTQGAGNAVSGSIISSDASSITVATSDGGSKIVLISGSTSISKTEEAGPADLATGEDVVVFGTTNDDGTVTATRIQLGAGLAQVQGQPPTGTDTPTTVAQ